MKLLLVRLSSFGDIVHAFPTASDIKKRLPNIELHWLVDDSLADLVHIHPAVDRVHTVPFRRWKREGLWAVRHLLGDWRTIGRHLREQHFDMVVDIQGLLKSAKCAAETDAPHIVGLDKNSAREAAAARYYTRQVAVSPTAHSVERQRQVAASALSYELPPELNWGLVVALYPGLKPYAVWVPGSSQAKKALDLELGYQVLMRLVLKLDVVVLWGSSAEQQHALELQKRIGEPVRVSETRSSAHELARTVRTARMVLGVDSGPTHLAQALGVPTLGLYRHNTLSRTGLYGASADNHLVAEELQPEAILRWAERHLPA